MKSERIHDHEIELAGGRRIGRLTLDNPAALNATRLDMIQALADALHRWEHDPNVVAVMIDAVSDKAFCAGGDIVNLYRAITGEIEADYPRRFFTEEYRLCYNLRTMVTPCIAWGHGIVMGGGCGLFSGCSHRVVTATTRLAMPEIRIGLFPDCAASWFFNRLPAYLARFIMLTGATLDSADCLFAGLAEHAIAHTEKQQVLDDLEAADWQGDGHATVEKVLAAAEATSPAARLDQARLMQHAATIRDVGSGSDLAAIVANITALTESEDDWLAECARNLADGCPTTAHLVDRQIREGRYLSLAENVRREYAMAMACCAHADFAEGVRALLIDKDKRPRWTHDNVADVPAAHIDTHFTLAGDETHPLADLAPIPPASPR